MYYFIILFYYFILLFYFIILFYFFKFKLKNNLFKQTS
jgi:hypothetical protein